MLYYWRVLEPLIGVGHLNLRFINQLFSQVMVFAKSYCPHCRMTRSLLEKTKKESKDPLDLEIIDLDKLPGSDGPMIQSHLLEISGQRTVPNIFINKKHMGGNSELHQLNTLGKLKSILSTGGSSGNTKSEL